MTDDNWPDDLPAMHKSAPQDDLTELFGKVPAPADAAIVLWLTGPHGGYAWYGLEKNEALAVLERMARELRKEIGPSPTKH